MTVHWVVSCTSRHNSYFERLRVALLHNPSKKFNPEIWRETAFKRVKLGAFRVDFQLIHPFTNL
jgi:hypothetical protein